MTLSQDTETGSLHMPVARKAVHRSGVEAHPLVSPDETTGPEEYHMPAARKALHRPRHLRPSLQKAARLQGIYFLLAGFWPLLHRRSFEAVTGPKKDWWLVQTVGVLVGSIGCSLLLSQRRRNPGAETRTLAVGSALGLAAIDGYHAGRGRIRSVYLLDMAAQAYLLQLWLRPSTSRR